MSKSLHHHAHSHQFRRPWLRYILLLVPAFFIAASLCTNVSWASFYYHRTRHFAAPPSDTPFISNNQTLDIIGDSSLFVDSEAQRRLEGIDSEEETPALEWEKVEDCPVGRLDGYSVQIGHLLYAFQGYATIDEVHSRVDVLDLRNGSWIDCFDTPKEMAHSHLGVVTDGRYVYVITGQYGPQCRMPISLSFVLDTKTRKWSSFPSLPFSRYAPATTLWRGRLHVMGGSKEDRWEPAVDHWSIAVKDGKALEPEWRNEIPIPRGGPHRACVILDDKLYVIGGQEGDFQPKPGSPIFKCSRRKEVQYGDVYMLEGDAKEWKVLPPMPKANSHIECAWVIVNKSIITVGGTTMRHPVTKRMILLGDVFEFNTETLKWRTLGQMPFRVKTTLVGLWDGWLYFTAGQRDRGPDDPSPKKIIRETWRTKLDF